MNDILIVLLPALFLGSIFSAIAGSGLGIILIIVFTLFFDIQTSVVFMALIGFIIQPAKVLHFYRHADWSIIRPYILTGFPLSYAGGLLLFDVPFRTLELIIAGLCAAFVLVRISHWKFILKPTKGNLLFWGGLNGLQGGVVGLGNFLRNPILLAFGLRKERFLGTAAVISVVLNVGKMAAYVPNIDWTKDIAVMLAASVPPVFAGVYIGKKMHRFISEETFERLVLLVIVVGIVKLLLFP